MGWEISASSFEFLTEGEGALIVWGDEGPARELVVVFLEVGVGDFVEDLSLVFIQRPEFPELWLGRLQPPLLYLVPMDSPKKLMLLDLFSIPFSSS